MKPKITVEITGPLVGDDFIPYKQLVVTFNAEDLTDWAASGKSKEAIKGLLLDAIEEKLDEVIKKGRIGGGSIG